LCVVGRTESTKNALGVQILKTVRVLLVVGGESFLARRLLETAQHDSVEVVGCAETVEEAASMADFCKPDVVLVADGRSPGWEASNGAQLDALKTSLRLASSMPDHDPVEPEPEGN
jgi:chemotaxis response regulator CheB